MTLLAGLLYLEHEQWLAEGKRLFGDDYFAWRFRCPVCGNVATSYEFQHYKEQGAEPDTCTRECIGRYAGGPCNYAGYGLFKLSPVRVRFPDGTEKHCFAFAAQESPSIK